MSLILFKHFGSPVKEVPPVERVQTEIQFVAKYRERLHQRRKHGTIRAGRRVPASLVLPVRITETGEIIGNAEILEVRWLKLRHINTPEILDYEYPSDIGALRKDLDALYPGINDDSWVTFFRFKFTDEGEEL